MSKTSVKNSEIVVGELPGEIKISADEALIPAGEYWFGDPCYTAGMDNVAWNKWVDIADRTGNGFADGVVGATYDSHSIVAANTLFGDGVYKASNGVSYPVDAGMLGVVPKKLIEEMDLDFEKISKMGSWVKVDVDTMLSRSKSGVIVFGELTIETGDTFDDSGDEDKCVVCNRWLDNRSLCPVCDAEDW